MKNKTLHVVFLSGSAAVGKTSVANKISEIAGDGFHVTKTLSTTRSTYARLGISTEQNASELGYVAKCNLQNAICEDYTANLVTKVRDSLIKASLDDKTHVLVVDRSPYDHAAYQFLSLPEQTIHHVRSRYQSVDDTFRAIYDMSRESDNFVVHTKMHVFFFDYPAPWMFQNNSIDYHEDGFRTKNTARNIVWSLALESMLKKEAATPYRTPFFKLHSFSKDIVASLPELRAQHVLFTVTGKSLPF